jgi:hypothetical protein
VPRSRAGTSQTHEKARRKRVDPSGPELRGAGSAQKGNPGRLSEPGGGPINVNLPAARLREGYLTGRALKQRRVHAGEERRGLAGVRNKAVEDELHAALLRAERQDATHVLRAVAAAARHRDLDPGAAVPRRSGSAPPPRVSDRYATSAPSPRARRVRICVLSSSGCAATMSTRLLTPRRRACSPVAARKPRR